MSLSKAVIAEQKAKEEAASAAAQDRLDKANAVHQDKVTNSAQMF